MNADKPIDLDLMTERLLGAVFEVSNTLGVGFIEKVHERALLRELGLRGLRATTQISFEVFETCEPGGAPPMPSPTAPASERTA